ncbi:protein lin-52 homolog isoform X2 [Aricia agestis]|uniref:protein lin-52 homolog isoform X2 n=1 Tax=Aricia agestis TaxID=91739 RepID=UPI001C2050EB|nr:protein lin-52 homolog isoform X2 [Aricia agestis]
MAAKQNSIFNAGQASDDIPLPSLEESLMSLEKLDRASPELWPEQIPGVSEYAPQQNSNQSPPSWSGRFTKEDYKHMQQLGSLTAASLILEVKKLHDIAYQLGLEEAKEMTRGTYLNIFSSRR